MKPRHPILDEILKATGLDPSRSPTSPEWNQILTLLSLHFYGHDESRRILERSSRISNQELEERISMLEQQLEKSVSTAKFSAVGDMAAGVAHEINNPLTIILGKAGRLQKEIREKTISTEDLLNGIERIESTALRIGKIVNGLRSISKDASEDPSQPFEVKRLIEDTLDLYRNRIENAGIELRVTEDLISAPLKANGKVRQLSQVLFELITNAIEATELKPEGPRWIEIRLKETPLHAEIRLSDSGPGIPGSTKGRLMNPFVTSKPVGRGLGLTLSTAKKVLTEHNGKFYFDELAPHTTFVLSLLKSGDR